MFGSNNGSEESSASTAGGSSKVSSSSKASTAPTTGTSQITPPSLDTAAAVQTPATERKRKSSKASQLIASAKNTIINSTTSEEKEFHKVLKDDPQVVAPGSNGNSAGESNPGPKSTFRVGVTEDKNKKCRKTMEDTHAYLYNFLPGTSPTKPNSSSPGPNPNVGAAADDSTESDNGYFAIFDGHAGTFAADWCGRKLHVVLEETIRKYPNHPVPELLDMTFTSCDGQLEKLPVKNSGCTAVCAVLRWEERPVVESNSAAKSNRNSLLGPANGSTNNVSTNNENAKPNSPPKTEIQRILYTANVGDARIVLCRNGKALRLSYDHKGSDENEGKRVANAGGLILNNRVNGVLAVTRALGDSYMKELVTGHPYTTETSLRGNLDEFIILACDGLWDVCSDQEAVDLIRNVYDPQKASKMLVDYALSRFSSDNLSCMIVRLDPTAKFEALQAEKEAEKESEKEDNLVTVSEGGMSAPGVDGAKSTETINIAGSTPSSSKGKGKQVYS
ncbi:putative phosphoprotein phosphatase 2C [Geopyxis carbonaria]|nr:putative phosphoprotein phosphatase 2C [Geopyxis carbonaria]